MTPMWIIIVSILITSASVTVIALSVRAIRDQSRITNKRRAEMLESLKVSRDTTLELAQAKRNAEEYKGRLKLIAARHVDSDDVPGYCAADDLPWPCPTADLANLRKNPDLVGKKVKK